MKKILRFYFWVLCVSGLLSPLFAQEQFPQGIPDIPEPMVFDLVRELGARRGELEINVLAVFPLSSNSSHFVEWAPEIEYAIWDNFAVEFELPIEDGTLEALKVALQYTFGKSKSGRFIHGTQFMIEKIRNKAKWDFSLLYIP
ncbi:MAG: hypothetical protein WBN55_12465, partial [Eudoraea sp.]|uniref:hypothetical protein n=1 Tax=Eudoraea sp. TaxID=1979955 RepID=UPI003C747A17